MINQEIKKMRRQMDFGLYLKEKLRNPEFKKAYDEEGKKLEIAYQILQMRKKSGLSQAQLAKKLRTTQSNIARMEAGNQNVTTQTLFRIARVFKRDLKVEFIHPK